MKRRGFDIDLKEEGSVQEEVKEEIVQPERERKKRIPLTTRNILTAPGRKGYKRRFVNDVGDRVQKFLDAGYTFVKDDIKIGDSRAGEDNPIGSTLNKSVGGGVRAVLMEQREDWYEEDQKERMKAIDEQEASLARQQGRTPDKNGQYGEVTINHGK